MTEKEILGKKLMVINIGLKSFGDCLKKQRVKVVHVDWQPPAGGDLQLLELLDKLQ